MNISNISMVYSGGDQAYAQSLGGPPSSVVVTNNKNNLFSDVPQQEAIDGLTDYKCIYVFNDDTGVGYKITFIVNYLDAGNTTVQLGFLQQDAVQNLNFTANTTAGTFTLTIQNQTTPVINWNNDPNILMNSIQTAIKTLTDCSIVSASPGKPDYNITFLGNLGNKAINSLQVTNNNLTPSGTAVITQLLQGSPINTITVDTIPGVAPTGIAFQNASNSGIMIGVLFPSEGIPVWIKRIVPPGSNSLEGDGFSLEMQFTSVPLLGD